MATPQLGLFDLASSTADQEGLINENFTQVDNAGNRLATATVTGSPYTATDEEYTENRGLILTGTPGAGFNLDLPATSRPYVVFNDTDAVCTVQVVGGGGDSIDVPVGGVRQFMNDGTDIRFTGGVLANGVDPVGVSSTALTTYSFQLSDANGLKRFTSGSAVSATVEEDSTTEFPTGTFLMVMQEGAGQLTLLEGGATTFLAASIFTLRAQNSLAMLIKLEANTWVLTGDVNLS